MNEHQSHVLNLMRQRPDRDLYEGASLLNPADGSGRYWLSYSAGETYAALTAEEVGDLERKNLLVAKWPGCYRLVSTADHTNT